MVSQFSLVRYGLTINYTKIIIIIELKLSSCSTFTCKNIVTGPCASYMSNIMAIMFDGDYWCSCCKYSLPLHCKWLYESHHCLWNSVSKLGRLLCTLLTSTYLDLWNGLFILLCNNKSLTYPQGGQETIGTFGKGAEDATSCHVHDIDITFMFCINIIVFTWTNS